MKVLLSRVVLALVAFTASAGTPCLAQTNANAIFGLLGNAIAMAQVQAAADAWSKFPEVRRYCFDRAIMQPHRTDIARLIQNGVMPNHPNLAPITNDCMRFEPSALKANYPCSINDESGNRVQTVCTQTFARQLHSGIQPLDRRAAIDVYFSTGV